MCHLWILRSEYGLRQEQIDQGKFALSVAVKVLQFYEEKFQVDYPLPKQGMKEKQASS